MILNNKIESYTIELLLMSVDIGVIRCPLTVVWNLFDINM